MKKMDRDMKEKGVKDVNMAEQADTVAEQEVTEQAQVADELAKLRDDHLRLQAEFDNYRRRTLREKLELAAAGGEEVIRALLPVLDDTDRAIDAMTKSDDIESARTGMGLVGKKLRDTLAAQGLAEIDALGADMDTDLHEAVARTPAEGQKGKVVDVVQKGYKLRDKVVRHAKCVVGE
jgi:molecular chaperone GrpE